VSLATRVHKIKGCFGQSDNVTLEKLRWPQIQTLFRKNLEIEVKYVNKTYAKHRKMIFIWMGRCLNDGVRKQSGDVSTQTLNKLSFKVVIVNIKQFGLSLSLEICPKRIRGLSIILFITPNSWYFDQPFHYLAH